MENDILGLNNKLEDNMAEECVTGDSVKSDLVETSEAEYVKTDAVKISETESEEVEVVKSDIAEENVSEADVTVETESAVVEESKEVITEKPEPNFYSYGSGSSVSQDMKSEAQSAEENNVKEKKSGKFLSKLKFVGMAAAFGIISGAAFVGVTYAADALFEKEATIPEDITGETTGIVINRNDNASDNVIKIMDVSEIVENSMPSAVAITGKVVQSYTINPFFGGSYETEAPVSGSGIIIGQNDTELLMVTNAHVVDGVNDLTVTFIDGSTAGAVVKGMKSNKDIAVIAVSLKDLDKETLEDISIIEIGDSQNLKMGQPVVAIGNAMGEGQSSTVGWVSALDRTIVIDGNEYENLIMTDAAINPGNSGGALLNMDGQLVGINSAKYSDESIEGMGYAIPISAVADIINDLMNREVRSKVDADKIGYLGFSGMDIDASMSRNYGLPEGILVTMVSEGSPAEISGLLKNDIIVGFDGEDITSFEQLLELMEYYAEGETIVVEFYRVEDGEYVLKSIEATLANRKDAR